MTHQNSTLQIKSDHSNTLFLCEYAWQGLNKAPQFTSPCMCGSCIHPRIWWAACCTINHHILNKGNVQSVGWLEIGVSNRIREWKAPTTVGNFSYRTPIEICRSWAKLSELAVEFIFWHSASPSVENRSSSIRSEGRKLRPLPEFFFIELRPIFAEVEWSRLSRQLC